MVHELGKKGRRVDRSAFSAEGQGEGRESVAGDGEVAESMAGTCGDKRGGGVTATCAASTATSIRRDNITADQRLPVRVPL